MKRMFAAMFILAMVGSAVPVSAATLAEQLSGQIVLQVESKGEAWYINPVTKTRFYLGRPEDAFNVMKKLGLGITNDQIKTIPIGLVAQTGIDTDKDGLVDLLENAIGTSVSSGDTDKDGVGDKTEVTQWSNPLVARAWMTTNSALVTKMKGRILLQVQAHGEGWYVSPKTNKRYFLGRPADAFMVMRTLGLGISNANLAKIPVDANSSLGSGPTAPVAVTIQELRITAKNFTFSPATMSVAKGSTVRVVLSGLDSTHGFSLPAYNINLTVAPGETKTAQFIADTAGTFTFTCPFHSGMKGTITVQ